MAASKGIPRDAQVMASILKDMGIIEYEPRVVNQMLEFTYRYITNILEDARVFSSHAKKKSLDIDDVKLAIQMQMDKSFTTPPPRDILIDISRHRNNIPLPLIKPHCGPRLPPDRYCLAACNYRLKPAKKHKQIGSTLGGGSTSKLLGSKTTPAVNLTSKSGHTLSLVNSKGSTTPTVAIVTSSRTGNIGTAGAAPAVKLETTSAPNPVIKLTSGLPSTSVVASGASSTSSFPLNAAPAKVPTLITRTVVSSSSPDKDVENPGKRKREDDDYDVE